MKTNHFWAFLFSILFCSLPFSNFYGQNCEAFFKTLPQIPVQDIVTRKDKNTFLAYYLEEIEHFQHEEWGDAKSSFAEANIPIYDVLVGAGYEASSTGWKAFTDDLKISEKRIRIINKISINTSRTLSRGIAKGIDNCTLPGNIPTGVHLYSRPNLNPLHHGFLLLLKPSAFGSQRVKIELWSDYHLTWDGEENPKKKHVVNLGAGDLMQLKTPVSVTRPENLANKTIPIYVKVTGDIEPENINVKPIYNFPAKIHIVITETQVVEIKGPFTYRIETITHKKDHSGTNDVVRVRLVGGNKKHSSWYVLNNPGDDRRKNQFDNYTIVEKRDIGKLKGIEIKLTQSKKRKREGKKHLDDWRILQLNIIDFHHPKKKYAKTFPAGKNVGDGSPPIPGGVKPKTIFIRF